MCTLSPTNRLKVDFENSHFSGPDPTKKRSAIMQLDIDLCVYENHLITLPKPYLFIMEFIMVMI